MNEMQNYAPNEGMAPKTVSTEMMISRQAQEVQAAMVVAKRFPRNEVESHNRILNACKRRSLAERAVYEYPRGGENVTGPSIRLAEVMAQNWGNLDFGITELEQKGNRSTVMAYCWDLETNVRQTKIFEVPHVRQTKKGTKALTDPRDIYEMVANQGARRMRACILGIIPGDVVDAAVDACSKTLLSGGEPLIDRIRKMAQAFQEDFGVPLECLEKYIGCKAEAFTSQSIVKLRGVYTALKDGRADREQYFDLPTVDEKTGEVMEETSAETVGTPDDGKTDSAPKQVSLSDL